MKKEEIERIAGFYGLTEARVAGVLRGTQNLVVRLESSQGPVVVRRLRSRVDLESRVREQHEYLRYLAARGLPVVPPCTAAHGQTIVEFEGATYDVYPFIDGARCKRDEIARIAAAGRVLGRLHAVATHYPQGMSRRDFRGRFLRRVAAFPMWATRAASVDPSPDVNKSIERLRAFLSDLAKGIRLLPYERLPLRILHGDYHGGNLLFRSDEVIAVLDFDNVGVDTRILDVAIALAIFARRSSAPLEARTVDAFMSGYRSVTELRHLERQSLPVLVAADVANRALRDVRRVGRPGNLDQKQLRERLRRRVERLRWALTSAAWQGRL